MVHALFVAAAACCGQAAYCPAPAYAQGYGRPVVRYGAPAYQQPVYQKPAYQKPVYHDPTPTLVVGVPVTNLGLKYYYSVGEDLRTEQITNQVTNAVIGQINAAQQQAVAQFQAQQQQAAQQQPAQPEPEPAPPPVAPQPQPPPTPVAPLQPLPSGSIFGSPARAAVAEPTPVRALPPTPEPPQARPPVQQSPGPAVQQQPATQGPPLDTLATEILMENCAACHAPGRTTGGIQLLAAGDQPYYAATRTGEIVRRSRIVDAVAHVQGVKPMPKNGKPLPPEQVDTLREWLLDYVSNGR